MENKKIFEDFFNHFVFEKKGHLMVKVYKPFEKPRAFGIIHSKESGIFEITMAREPSALKINLVSDLFKFMEEECLLVKTFGYVPSEYAISNYY